MSKGYPTPLTWARLLELAAQGRDHYDAALTSTRARQLVASVREHFSSAAGLSIDETLAWSKCQGRLTAAIATLDRLREALALVNQNGDLIAFRGRVTFALAGKPEAPKGQEPWQALFPQAQAEWDRLKGDLAAANAKVAQVSEECDAYQMQRDAANARIAELETDRVAFHETLHDKQSEIGQYQRACEIFETSAAIATNKIAALRDERDAANARADAAERAHTTGINAQVTELEARLETAETERDQLAGKLDAAERQTEEVRQMRDAAEAQHGAQIVGLRDERDQHAARVKELEQDRERIVDDLGSNQPTPEERAVLEAMKEAEIESVGGKNRRRFVFMFELQEDTVCRAELANRAAKAKRGEK